MIIRETLEKQGKSLAARTIFGRAATALQLETPIDLFSKIRILCAIAFSNRSRQGSIPDGTGLERDASESDQTIV